MNLHHRLNSPRLVVLLQQWAREDTERPMLSQAPGVPPPPDVAEQLSQGMGTVDAVKLSRALHAIETLPHNTYGGTRQGPPLDGDALHSAVQTTRAELIALITAGPSIPRPARARADNTPVGVPDPQADADFAAYGPRYLDLQKQLDTRLLALRALIRHSLANGSAPLRQLVALDIAMEQVLCSRELRLWALLPGYLERRLAQRRQTHQQTLQASGQPDAPLRWRQPGGWLWAFEQDFQALLLAQMQVRLQPIMGLLEAAHTEKTGQLE